MGKEDFPNVNLVLSICQLCNCQLDNTKQMILKMSLILTIILTYLSEEGFTIKHKTVSILF
jgi:hypothetical protein